VPEELSGGAASKKVEKPASPENIWLCNVFSESKRTKTETAIKAKPIKNEELSAGEVGCVATRKKKSMRPGNIRLRGTHASSTAQKKTKTRGIAGK
jgi:hypothetical protein